MLHSAGYRLALHPAHVFCPLCTLPGNPRVPLQPCCLYPGEVYPEPRVELPLALRRSPPYGFVAEQFGVTSFSPYTLQSSAIDIARTQPARHSTEDTNSNNARDGTSQQPVQRFTTSSKKKRRKRTIFTCEQLSRLESEFADQQYMVGAERQQLAEALKLSETQIKIWFQNRRIKWRKENKQHYPDFLAGSFSLAAVNGAWKEECVGSINKV